jgi:GTP-binding protein
VLIEVPEGTIIRDAERGNVLRDLTEAGEQVRVCRGGRGGRGNARFATATDQAPRRAEPGSPGEARELTLELKLIADVGLIGLPNAGKSTLLSSISAARPRVADYPFTTLEPCLGIVDAGGFRTFVVADLPGLVAGAHAGVGLGHRFLRHAERTRVLLHVVDLAPMDSGDPLESYQIIRRELEQHPVDLEERTEVIALNKIDLLGAGGEGTALPEAVSQWVERFREQAGARGHVVAISAATGAGLGRLIGTLADLLADTMS